MSLYKTMAQTNEPLGRQQRYYAQWPLTQPGHFSRTAGWSTSADPPSVLRCLWYEARPPVDFGSRYALDDGLTCVAGAREAIPSALT